MDGGGRERARQLSYSEAGVDIEAQDRAIESFKAAVAASHEAARRGGAGSMLAGVGAFGAAFLPDLSRFKEPVLVSSTDGLGTKVLLHARFGTWELAGRDLVGTVINDVICSGARPLFMLDYIGWHGLSPAQLSEIVGGVARGCAEIGCALAGGELAEMRDIYKRGDFDLTGTAVGAVDRDRLLGPERVRPGSAIIGLRSSGIHANGFSLVRKALAGLSEEQWQGQGPAGSLAESLLRPTFCYANALRDVFESPHGPAVQAAAHISGGGLVDNLPRVVPQGLGVVLSKAKQKAAAGPVASLFDIIREHAAAAGLDISEAEMYRVFNMGTGFVIISDPEATQGITALLQHAGVAASQIGAVVTSDVTFAWAE